MPKMFCRINLSHNGVLIKVYGFAGDIGAYVADGNRAAKGGENDGNAGPVDTFDISHPHLKGGDAGAGISGGNNCISLASFCELGDNRDGTFYFLS